MRFSSTLYVISSTQMYAVISYLTSPVSDDEIKGSGRVKGPGLDGFKGIFYHSFWDTIVEEVNGLICDLMNDTNRQFLTRHGDTTQK